jgi:hypothetical protein
MDHLSCPLSPTVQPLEIPLVATLVFDGQFSDFLRLHGFFKEDAVILNLSRSQMEHAAFISWLWFGVLSTFAARRIDLHEFSRPKGHRQKGDLGLLYLETVAGDFAVYGSSIRFIWRTT